jgi:glycosyltransferase involved in cell wall biosynthesis
MMVLHADAGREWRGGQRQTLLLARGMAARGLDVAVASPDGSPLADRGAAAGLRVLRFGPRGDLDLGSAARLSRHALAHRARIVHAHDARSHAAARLAGALGRPWRLVVTRRTAFRARRDPFTRLKYGWGVDRYIAISGSVRDGLLAAGAPEDRVRIVPDGVEAAGGDVAAVDWRVRLGLPAASTLVGSLGALSPEKGHAILIDALAAMDDGGVHAVLMGTGPEAERLRALAAERGVAGRVHLAGQVADPLAAIAGLDVFVQPSLAEGFGSAVLDAMGMGRPIIAAAAGGLAEVVEPESSGLLVPAGDAAALAAAMARLLADDPLRRRLVEGGRRRAEAFSVDAMVAGTLAVYAELAALP